MNKNPFILLLLLLSSYSHAQKMTLGIPPVYTVEVDTTEWSVLYEKPEAMMLSQYGIPQEFVHKKTGFVIWLNTGYMVDINCMKWLNKMIAKQPASDGYLQNKMKTDLLSDPLASQRRLLFGTLKPMPEQSLLAFEAYQSKLSTLSLANCYLWMTPTHYIQIHSQKITTEEQHQWLKEIVTSVQTTSTQEMDAAAEYPLLQADTMALYKHRRRILDNSHSEISKQLLSLENDRFLLNDLDFPFTFTAMHQSMIRFVEHQITLEELLQLREQWSTNNTNPYVVYHLRNKQKEILLTQIQMEKTIDLFPSSIHKIEQIFPPRADRVDYFEGYNDSIYYLLQLDFSKGQLTHQLDSLRYDHWIQEDGKIERQKYESLRFSGPIQMESLKGTAHHFSIHTKQSFRTKERIYRSFDAHYFYRPSSKNQHLFPFRIPPKTANYETFAVYEIDLEDQKIIDRFYASGDTMRYYTSGDMEDESPNVIMYRGAKKMEYKSLPQKRLYGTSVFTTDLNQNNELEYWQFYVCNGTVIQTNFYSTLEADDSLKKQQKKVLKLPVLQKLISTSTSTGINNHQMLFHSNGSFENEFIQDIAVEAEEGALREDRSILMERDTTVYQYPTRQAIFMPMDPDGIQFMESQLGHTPFSQLPTHTHYKVSFIIEKDGSLSHLSVRCIGGRLVMAVEDKLFDIVRAMPKWKPATYEGYPVRSYGSLHFGLYLKDNK